MENDIIVSFTISKETKEQIDCLFQEMNRPVSHDEFLSLLVRAYYRANSAPLAPAEPIAPAEPVPSFFGPEASDPAFPQGAAGEPAMTPDQMVPSALRELNRDRTDYRRPDVRLSGRPAYTKYGVFYSGVEPRVNP